ncbi:hypothetical protein G3N93_00425 [Burkholderia sp. Se-20378]|nr:hypothetical protein [Burkholderia sp. Se-20378]
MPAANGIRRNERAWIEEQVPQCGYCQSGMLMAASLLRRRPDPTDDQIAEAVTTLCRCGTYGRVRDAIRLAARSERNTSE